jgi:plasmid maintenance system antidote protein VapI
MKQPTRTISMVSKVSDTLRRNIPAIAKEQRHKLKDVAGAGGVTYRTLKYFIDGNQDMKVGTATKIADFFGYTLTGLINWREK